MNSFTIFPATPRLTPLPTKILDPTASVFIRLSEVNQA